jgi:hypothetical protein
MTRDYTLQITVTHAKSFTARNIFTNICLVTAPTMAIPVLPCSSPLWMALPTKETQSQSLSELIYDGRFTGNQFVLSPSPLRSAKSIFFQLSTWGFCPYGTSSLTWGWVCRLQLLLALANAVILGSESRGTHDCILLSEIRDSPNLEDTDCRRKHRFQQYLYCCVMIHCCGDVFVSDFCGSSASILSVTLIIRFSRNLLSTGGVHKSTYILIWRRRARKWPLTSTSVAEVKNDGAITPLPHTSSWRHA